MPTDIVPPKRKWTKRTTRSYHGMCFTKTYRIWSAMIDRCQNPNDSHYHCYGGRGITVCKRWLNFYNFLADMGEKPEGRTLDRLNNNKGYYKKNCAWRTSREQARNMNTNHWIAFGGRRMILSDWAAELGIKVGALLFRLSKWPLERALTEKRHSQFDHRYPRKVEDVR